MPSSIGTAMTSMRMLPLALGIIVAVMTATSCKEEHREVVKGKLDLERVPTMLTRNVETLISDSGIMRYRITSPLWLMFDEASRPKWIFPDGLKLERYNDLAQKDATVECDSATYFKQEQLWRLDGHVKIFNTLNEKFLTQQLFWDQRNHTVYSDSFIHIEKSDRIIEGHGFRSNEKMTSYKINQVAGIFPTEGLKSAAGPDTINSPQPPASYPGDKPQEDESQNSTGNPALRVVKNN